MTRIPPICPYCFTPARISDGVEVYGTPGYGAMYVCGNYPECDAYVGVHKGTQEPLGRLANAELRQAKVRAHKAFDPLWQSASALYDLPDDEDERRQALRRIRSRARTRAYAWLAEQLGTEVEHTHIGWFDVDQCYRTIRACRDATPARIREWAKSTEGVK